jgi:trans-aconitate methyltransferase
MPICGHFGLDVGCGTGARYAAIVDRCSPSSVAGVEPSAGFLKTATQSLADRATRRRTSISDTPGP